MKMKTSSNISQIIVNSEPNDDIHAATKSYVDCLSENDRNKRDLSTVFNDQDNEVINTKLTDLVCFTVNRSPNSDNGLSSKRFFHDD